MLISKLAKMILLLWRQSAANGGPPANEPLPTVGEPKLNMLFEVKVNLLQ